MPPRPSSRSMRYSPTIVPGARSGPTGGADCGAVTSSAAANGSSLEGRSFIAEPGEHSRKGAQANGSDLQRCGRHALRWAVPYTAAHAQAIIALTSRFGTADDLR